MIFIKNRRKATFCVAVVLLFLGLVWSCKTTPPDLRGELVRSLKGEDVEGFHFATEEDESQTFASLTNSAVRNLIPMDNNTTNLVLKYTLVKEKKTSAKRTYKAEVVKTGTKLALVVTDIATGEVVSRKAFPEPEPHDLPKGPPTFDTLDECIANFNCMTAPVLQCKANRTCEDQLAHLICCLNDGQCFSVVLIIRPTAWICIVSRLIPNFGVFLHR
jgi:hypothetical protein